MDRRGQPWTTEEDACLRSLRAIDLPEDEIATSLGRNEEDVIRRMLALRLVERSPAVRRDHAPPRGTLALRNRVGKAFP
jgi:hypothetical protein